MAKQHSSAVNENSQPTIPYQVPKRRKINIPLISSLVGGAAVALTGILVYYNIIRNEYRPTPREPTKQTQISGQSSLTAPIPSLETPTPIPVLKPFELTCDTCTAEELELYYKIAEEDYNAVKQVYGVEKGRIKIIVDKDGYGIDFYFEDRAGGAAGGHGDFTIDPTDRGLKHEMSHALTAALFPTYHSWFDEGLAMYASGEVDNALSRGMENALEEIKNDSYKYFTDYKQRNPNVVPGHVIGNRFFGFLVTDYKMIPQQNRTALSILRRKYLETGRESTKADIKEAYETALGVRLDPLFNLLRPGIMTLYPDFPGTHIEKIRNEF